MLTASGLTKRTAPRVCSRAPLGGRSRLARERPIRTRSGASRHDDTGKNQSFGGTFASERELGCKPGAGVQPRAAATADGNGSEIAAPQLTPVKLVPFLVSIAFGLVVRPVPVPAG